MILYFTGTGNSRYCADFLADKLQEQVTNAFHFMRDGIAAELISDTPWVFVCPTYAWQMPKVFEDFLRAAWLQGSRDAYFVMTCGADTGEAGKYNAQLCKDLGLTYKGTATVVMPENYTAMFPVPDDEKARKIIKKALPGLAAAADCIKAGQPLPEKKSGPLDKLKSGAVNKGFKNHFISDKKFYATDACIGCGLCAQLCVLNNIRMAGDKPAWHGSCTHCMACINSCPKAAIEYGRASRGKPRYLAPKYEK